MWRDTYTLGVVWADTPRAGLPLLGTVAVAAGTASLTASHSAKFSDVREWDVLLIQLSVQDIDMRVVLLPHFCLSQASHSSSRTDIRHRADACSLESSHIFEGCDRQDRTRPLCTARCRGSWRRELVNFNIL